MDGTLTMAPVAHIRSDFPTKFGIPRQSGLVEALRSTVIFAPEYRDPAALRGLEGFSHLWLVWVFSRSVGAGWSPTVRPPRLGGNERMGVFATRSPFRPNPIGLSCVRLEAIEKDPALGHVLVVSGADLMDGTPILDVTRRLWGALRPTAALCWRSTVRRSSWPGCRRTRPGLCWGCWPVTPAPPTSTTPTGSTVWTSPATTSAFPSLKTPSPCKPWNCWPSRDWPSRLHRKGPAAK